MFGSFVLASTFIVSHNIEGAKPAQQASGSGYQVTIAGKVVDAQSDWGMWQVVTSASWGGAVGSFFSGGLNLQARLAQPKTNRLSNHAVSCVEPGPGEFGTNLGQQ